MGYKRDVIKTYFQNCSFDNRNAVDLYQYLLVFSIRGTTVERMSNHIKREKQKCRLVCVSVP
jgi:hypothetical protein